MAALSITAADVAKGSNAVVDNGIAGATITAGQVLYIDTANGNVLKLADSDLSELGATVAGIALHAALTGQPIAYQRAGDITPGATLTVGETYVLDATAGQIIPIGDHANPGRTSILGVATTAAVLKMGILNSAAVRAA